MRPLLALLAAVALSCGGQSPPPAQPESPTPSPDEPPRTPGESPQQIQVGQDTPRTTEAGVAFVVPGGWKIIASGQISVMAPEPDSTVAMVDALGAKDADTAVAIAWKLHRSDFKRTVQRATDERPRAGWEQIRVFTYQVAPDEKRVVRATAMRLGDKWTVHLLDATEATIAKHGAQLAKIDASIRPPGR